MKKHIMQFLNYLQATKNLSLKSISAYQGDLMQFANNHDNLYDVDVCDYISYLSVTLG